MKTYPRLRGRIVEKLGTQGNFAKKIGRSEQTVIAKLNGKSSFTQDDIIVWSNALDLSKEDVGDYFFSEKL